LKKYHNTLSFKKISIKTLIYFTLFFTGELEREGGEGGERGRDSKILKEKKQS